MTCLSLSEHAVGPGSWQPCFLLGPCHPQLYGLEKGYQNPDPTKCPLLHVLRSQTTVPCWTCPFPSLPGLPILMSHPVWYITWSVHPISCEKRQLKPRLLCCFGERFPMCEKMVTGNFSCPCCYSRNLLLSDLGPNQGAVWARNGHHS